MVNDQTDSSIGYDLLLLLPFTIHHSPIPNLTPLDAGPKGGGMSLVEWPCGLGEMHPCTHSPFTIHQFLTSPPWTLTLEDGGGLAEA
jgi:hypothetical protein